MHIPKGPYAGVTYVTQLLTSGEKTLHPAPVPCQPMSSAHRLRGRTHPMSSAHRVLGRSVRIRMHYDLWS